MTGIALGASVVLATGVTIDGGSHVAISPLVGMTDALFTIAPTAAAQDFTLENLELAGPGGGAVSRGVIVEAGAGAPRDVTFSQLSVHGFTESEGSGIEVLAATGTVTVDSSTLDGNTATGVGGSALRYVAPNGVGLVISNTTVSGNQTTPVNVVGDGAISVEGSPAGFVTLTSDTFDSNQTGGPAPPPYNLVMGGAVSLGNDNGSSGALTVTDSTFTSNGARDAAHGAPYVGGALHSSRAASVTITNTVFDGNIARDIGSSIDLDNMSGPITLTDLTVSNGEFHDGGGTGIGGIFFANNTGTTTITGLTANGNSGGDGSVLEVRNQSGAFSVAGSDIEQNSAERGAIFFESVASAVSIDTTTFRGDSSSGTGAADISAGGITAAGSLTVNRSTFDSSDSSCGCVTGLAIYVPTVSGTLGVSGSTFFETGAQPVIRVDAANGTFGLANSTISGELGVDLGVINGTIARVSHTIVQVPVGVPALTVDAAGTGPNLDVRWSLLSSALGARQTNTAGNKLSTDALLGALADNGGPTFTMLPQSTSPAVDAGDPAFSDPITVDQRGLPRIVGTIDIGAVELQAPAALSATGVPTGGSITVAMMLLLLGLGLFVTRIVGARRRPLT